MPGTRGSRRACRRAAPDIGYIDGMATVHPRLNATYAQIETFCAKWKIVRFELFGSVLRDDFDNQSDVDVLVTFAPDARWTFRDDLAIDDELARLLGRHVDVVERKLIERSPNWVRRKSILNSATLVYAAA
jgi:predicted nucleotidyltransferase